MNIYIDGHCDTLKEAFINNDLISNLKYKFNLTASKNFVPIIQMLATFVGTDIQKGDEFAHNVIDYYLNNKLGTIQILNKDDIDYVINNKKIGILLTIENGKAIEKDLNNIDLFYEKGIRVMSLTWNDDNFIGCGAFTQKDEGLSEFGKKYVKKLEEKLMIIDVSHSSEKTFWDVYNITKKPIIATHSCCYSLVNHPRNLKDNQIRAIALRGGMIGICLCNPFLKKSGKANVENIIEHIDYIVKLVGEDFVGIGSDFDGVSKEHQLEDIKSICDMKLLEKSLIEYGYTAKTVNKIMGENWCKFLKNNL